jgi:four helix bundle protein
VQEHGSIEDSARLLHKDPLMSREEPRELREGTFHFTCDVYDYCQALVLLSGLPRRVGFQLFDAAASVASNLEEAKAAYSRNEFAAKNAISLKRVP